MAIIGTRMAQKLSLTVLETNQVLHSTCLTLLTVQSLPSFEVLLGL